MKVEFKNKIRLLILSLLIPGYFTLLFPGKSVLITVICYLPILLYLINYTIKNKLKAPFLFKVFIILSFIFLLRGVLDINSKNDIAEIVLEILPTAIIIPFAYLIGIDKRCSDIVVKFFLKNFYLLIIPHVIIFFLLNKNFDEENFVRFITPTYFGIIFFFQLNNPKKFFVLICIISSFLLAPGHRTNMIMLSYLCIITLIFHIAPRISRFFGKRIWLLLALVPFVFIVNSIKNFEVDFTNDYITDSRTTIYNDVLNAYSNGGNYFFGLGAVKIETMLVNSTFNENYIYDDGRRATEALLLNYFHWGGLALVIIFIVFNFKSVFYVLNNHKNAIGYTIGFFILFRCLYSLVELRIGYNVNSFIYFFMLGWVFSRNKIKKINS